jgi:plasmid replication initiation protein
MAAITHEQKLDQLKMRERKDENREIEIQRDFSVRKSNSLIQHSRCCLTLQEQRMMLYIISKIKPSYNASNNQQLTFNINDVIKICGIRRSGNALKTILAAGQNLRDKSVIVIREDGSLATAGWLAKFVVHNDRKTCTAILDEDLMPYLFNVQKMYTSYQLRNVLAMSSKFSIRLYEVMRSYLNLREHTFTVDELIELLCAELKKKKNNEITVYIPKSYLSYSKFRQSVLEPALKEINEYSDIRVDMVPHKEGRKVVKIRFAISPKTSIEMLETYDKVSERLSRGVE